MTKKQQTDLMALYQHRMSGGDVASAPVIAPVPPAASAATLGAFKNNLSNLTTSLTTAFPGAAARGKTAAAASSAAAPALGQEGYSAALLSRVSGQPPGGVRNPSTMAFTDAMSRTKEGFSKLFQTAPQL